MNMLTSGIFWGVIIVLLGVSLILKAVFNINFPFFRVLFGLIIIYFGVKVLTGGWSDRSSRDSAWWSGESHISYTEQKNGYSIVFGQGTIDLRPLQEGSSNRRIEAQIIFGEGKIRLPKDVPMAVEMHAAFGQVSLDKESVSGIGSSVWYSPSYQRGEPHHRIKANAVFGQANIEVD